MGTAVRAQSTTRPRSLFTTDLSGSDVAKLMQSGWTPVHVEWAGAAHAIYTGYNTQFQTSFYAGNTEVDVIDCRTCSRVAERVRGRALTIHRRQRGTDRNGNFPERGNRGEQSS